jgi:hypothetical protein
MYTTLVEYEEYHRTVYGVPITCWLTAVYVKVLPCKERVGLLIEANHPRTHSNTAYPRHHSSLDDNPVR